MNIKKSVASSVAGVMLAGMALMGCGSSHHHHDDYDRVYDTHSHTYVVVTHDYYIHHKNLYSGKPQVVSSPKSTKPAASSTTTSKAKKALCKIVKKHKKCKNS